MVSLSPSMNQTTYWLRGTKLPHDPATLAVEELPPTGILRLQAPRGDARVPQIAREALGLDLPPAGRLVADGHVQISCTTPDEWLLFCLMLEERALQERLERAYADCFVTVTVISDCQLGLMVNGPAAPDLLAKGCGLDTDPQVFAPGVACATRFAGLSALLLRPAEGSFRLYTNASYAAYLLSWLIDAAMEFQVCSANAS